MKNETTITGRLAQNQPELQDFWPTEKRVALAGIIYHWMYGLPCEGKDCKVCEAMKELKGESK